MNDNLFLGHPVDFYTMHINKGQDDEMQLCCYKRNNLRTVIVYILFVLTGGLLRLIFHWIPHLYLIATSTKCKIDEATKILITVSMSQITVIIFRHYLIYLIDI